MIIKRVLRGVATGLSMMIMSSCLLISSSQAQTKQKIQLGRAGRTAYSIYLDPSAPPSVKDAANELKTYFGKVAGLSLPIVISSTAPRGSFISLGNTSAAKSAGVKVTTIPNDGFRIATRGQNLFILGRDTPREEIEKLGGVANGTANGVYTFIEDYLGVHWLMPGELGEEYTSLNVVELPQIDRVTSPPFNYRVLPWIGRDFTGSDPDVKKWQKHLRLVTVANVNHSHAWTQTIPSSLFVNHPDWFPEIRGRRVAPKGIRYKLETTNPQLVQAYADAIVKTFRKNPKQRWYSLSPSDNDSGDHGWSESAETIALLEKDPYGELSRTKLILKFYNDVAKIVRKEFPDRYLAGYIYSSYLYPPQDGVPKLEPNLSLVLASSISYGFQLYRPDVQQRWERLIRSWGESSRRDGFNIYYFDLPTFMGNAWSKKRNQDILVPPAPEILNFIFPRLLKQGFKGALLYGSSDWVGSGSANYTIAHLLWNPNQNAAQILKKYYQISYGTVAATDIEKINNVLGDYYRRFHIRYPNANYNWTRNHMMEIYKPAYREIQYHYSKAYAAVKTPSQQRRLELWGRMISEMRSKIASPDK